MPKNIKSVIKFYDYQQLYQCKASTTERLHIKRQMCHFGMKNNSITKISVAYRSIAIFYVENMCVTKLCIVLLVC